MDRINLAILNRLRSNARTTYSEIAEELNMSVSAIHKRINNLLEEGTINTFIARPSFIALKYIQVWIFGTSKAKNLNQISQELGQHENISFVGISGGKFLYIAGSLRDISELQEFSSYVTNTAQMEPTVAIVNLPYKTLPDQLSTIDFKILKSLNRDAKKAITDIAEEVGISSKTVRKRIARMIKNNLALFTLEWTPLHSSSILTFFHIYLNEGSDLHSTIQNLNEKFSKNLIYCENYSNLPGFLILFTWAISPREAQRIQEELEEEGFKDIIPHILLSVKWYECWLDLIVRSS